MTKKLDSWQYLYLDNNSYLCWPQQEKKEKEEENGNGNGNENKKKKR